VSGQLRAAYSPARRRDRIGTPSGSSGTQATQADISAAGRLALYPKHARDDVRSGGHWALTRLSDRMESAAGIRVKTGGVSRAAESNSPRCQAASVTRAIFDSSLPI